MTKTKKKNLSKKVKGKVKIKTRKQMSGSGKKCMCIDYDIDNDNKMSLNKNSHGHKCQNPVANGSDFCPKHKDCMKFIQQYNSGYEPEYQPDKWNTDQYVKKSHNCYTYFLNKHVKSVKDRCGQMMNEDEPDKKCGKLKPQPGDFDQLVKYGTLKFKTRDYTCESMHNNIMNDNPSIVKSSATKKCPVGSYKGALVVDPNNTYHFYRQNPDGTWSHKPGTLEVSDKDASDQPIYFPHLADRDYKKDKEKGINYTDFCNYYCIPRTSKVNMNAI
jgi:hypothetical protein